MDPHIGAPIDANGNLTSDGTRTFEWDARNQLVALTAGTRRTESSYDGFQRRLRLLEKESGVVERNVQLIWCGLELCEQRVATTAGEAQSILQRGEYDSASANSCKDQPESSPQSDDATMSSSPSKSLVS